MKGSALDAMFRQAVAAVDIGDLAALEQLLEQHPELVRERLKSPGAWLRDQIGSALMGFYKHPYLLWFLTEDAVRTGKLAPNVGALARAIIDAARRERVKDLQEQLDTTLHFAVCSPIGREDGLQLQLLDVLIEGGATTDGAAEQAFICYNRSAAEHLLARGVPLTLSVAVCLERTDDIARLAATATRDEKQTSLALGALNGKSKGLAALIPFGVDLSAFSTGFYTHATPLHHAVWSGSLDAVKVLVEAGASLTLKDKAERATPLGWAEYAMTLPKPDAQREQFAAIAEYLRGRGAE